MLDNIVNLILCEWDFRLVPRNETDLADEEVFYIAYVMNQPVNTVRDDIGFNVARNLSACAFRLKLI